MPSPHLASGLPCRIEPSYSFLPPEAFPGPTNPCGSARCLVAGSHLIPPHTQVQPLWVSAESPFLIQYSDTTVGQSARALEVGEPDLFGWLSLTVMALPWPSKLTSIPCSSYPAGAVGFSSSALGCLLRCRDSTGKPGCSTSEAVLACAVCLSPN